MYQHGDVTICHLTTVECDQTSYIHMVDDTFSLKWSLPSTSHAGMLVCTQVTHLRSQGAYRSHGAHKSKLKYYFYTLSIIWCRNSSVDSGTQFRV